MALAILVQPPLRDFYITPHRFSGLGLEAVRRTLKRRGWHVDIRVFPLEGPGRALPLPEALTHLKPHLLQGETGSVRFFTGWRRFGPSFADAAAAILRSEPDLIVLECFAWAYADDAIESTRAIRALQSASGTGGGAGPSVIVGGAGVTVFPDYFDESGLFDAVLPGDAESALGGYLDEPGCSTAAERPEPLWTARRIPGSTETGGSRVTAVFSRGCPKRCRFCSQFLTQGRILRTAPLTQVDRAVARWPHDTVEVNIEDDNLLLDRDYFFQVLDRIRARFPRIRIYAENGVDYTLIDDETLEALWKRGFRRYNLSLGSVHPEVLIAQHRPANLRRWERLVQEIDRRGGTSTTYFICGLAEDSPVRTASTLNYLTRFPTRPGISLFYPVPGLPGFTDRSPFRRHPSYLAAGSSAWPWTGSLTTEQMVTAFRLSRLIGLLNSQQTSGDPELLHRCLETEALWTRVRDHGETRLLRVPHQDEEMSRKVLRETAKLSHRYAD